MIDPIQSLHERGLVDFDGRGGDVFEGVHVLFRLLLAVLLS